MSCPFYNTHITQLTTGEWTVNRFAFDTGSRCGLITDAHSPCYMEMREDKLPKWVNCPRNPSFGHNQMDAPVDAATRIFKHHLYMQSLIQIRKVKP
jgi:hypothetical protein